MFGWLFGRRSESGGGYCPGCGAANSAVARFCIKCGQRLSGDEEKVAARPVAKRSKKSAGLNGTSASRARRLIAEKEPNEQELANDAAYCNSKISEFTELSKLAIEACHNSGHKDAVAGLGRIQAVCMLLMAAWPGMRANLLADPNSRIWVVGVAMMLNSGWTTMVGMVQVLGLGESNERHPDEAKLMEDFGHVVTMATTLQQKMGL